MNKKDLEIPLKIRKLEALLRRLLETQPKYFEISDEYYRRLAGFKGEQSLKYELSYLKDKNYLVFHNLRLPDISGEHFFEIDILLVSPHYILIIDAKNYRGELYLDGKFDQLIQTYDDKKKSYSCPIAQINRHKLQLQRFLEASKFPPMPVETLVIFTNPSCIISASPEHKQTYKVIKSAGFQPKIELFEKRNRVEIMEKKHLQKLSRFLMKQHTPHDDNILKQYGITPDNLIKGVGCPKCGAFPMNRTQRSWHCASCNYSSPKAHLPSLNDYALLLGPTITNRQLRDFLLLDSISASKNILLSLNLSYTGSFKDRVYFLHLERL